MSVHKLTLLYCDAEDCPRGEGLGDVPFEASGMNGNAAQQRESAKQNGWIRRRGKDYCDQCAAKLNNSVDRTAKTP